MSSEFINRFGINNNRYRFIFWFGYVMVFVAAFVPLKIELHKIAVNIVSFEFHLDQTLHAVVYFLICVYFVTGQYLGLRLFRDGSFIKFLIVVLALATITETVQIFVPARTFNFFDILANLIGIGFGVGVIWIMGRQKAAG